MESNQTPQKQRYIVASSYAPSRRSAYFDLLNSAYTGNLDQFKMIASRYDCKGDGLAITIERLKDKLGRGSLIFAAAGGSVNVCRYLLEELNLEVDVKDNHGGTPLCYGAVKGHLNSVEFLLEKGANPNGSDDPNSTFNAPLQYAVLGGDIKIQKLLLSKGVRINFVTESGTPLYYAAVFDQLDSVKLLLDHHADPNVVVLGLVTPLIASILNDSPQITDLLLQAGADPNAESSGIAPLQYAVDYGLTQFIVPLLEPGADPNAMDNEGMTAVEIAAKRGKSNIVEILFPVTSCIPTYPSWTIGGLMEHVHSEAARKKKALEITPTDATLLSSRSACYACMQDGPEALKDATECISLRPDWPKAHYRAGVALNILKRYGEAADAFYKGLTLDPDSKELEDAFRDANEARLKSVLPP
ncbi:hypothetical protein C5167_035128 [Papaver somniferum]|uniref:Uncharacterized protein n=1 Tax=Papaver somniferum TaxID=3469 RepID=A0A4Y7KJA4_PAPSO|nr:ankyrin repeat and protein kinase domain-containing protein 1-like isoform X2 [Papaver somniferum]RZC71965.1 hypothetical protein C5167_035128 [Papaver somniferum]